MVHGIRKMEGGVGIFDKSLKQIGFANMTMSQWLKFNNARVVDTSTSLALVRF